MFGLKKRAASVATALDATPEVGREAKVYIEVYPAPTSTEDAPNFEFVTIVDDFAHMLGGGNTTTDAAVDAGKDAARKMVGKNETVGDTEVVVMSTFDEHLAASTLRDKKTFSGKN